jgi:large repetitive protein
VRGNGRETPLPATIAGEHLLLDNSTVWATNLNMTTLTLTNTAVLTHPVAGLTNEHRLVIATDTLVVSTNSRIDVSGRGYLGGRSGPNGGNTGRTSGNTVEGGSLRRNGGSYGGMGGFGSS